MSSRLTRMLILLLLFGCKPSFDLQEAAEELLQADREFARLSVEVGAAEAFNRFLLDDAMQLPNGQNPIYSRAAIFDSMRTGPQYTLIWQPQKAETSQIGDLGWTWGTYEASFVAEDNSNQSAHGKYLNVWRKQADGHWKVVVDMGNRSPAPE